MTEFSSTNNIKHEDCIILIKNFFKSFDTKNWILMKNCLNDNLKLDYRSFRGIPKYKSKAINYIEKRKIGLKDLDTEHIANDYNFVKSKVGIILKCSFEIKRYQKEGDKFYHSYGHYEFQIKEADEQLKIFEIKQEVQKNEGDRMIHGAFKTD